MFFHRELGHLFFSGARELIGALSAPSSCSHMQMAQSVYFSYCYKHPNHSHDNVIQTVYIYRYLHIDYNYDLIEAIFELFELEVQ